MRVITRLWFALAALLITGVVAGGCMGGALLSGVRLDPLMISPNADGDADVTHLYYQIRRTADVSIYFIDAAGHRYYFRERQRRSPGNYDVYWGGVVNDPEVREAPGGRELVKSRVLPDGAYTWVIEAVDDRGNSQKSEGQISLQNADTVLPELHNFTVVPEDFTPNQDAIHDRVSIGYYLTKKSERVQVYLVPAPNNPIAGQPGTKFPVPQDQAVMTVEVGEAGYHGYSYDGGVDLNAEPPPDGDYVVYAEAEDKVGNRVEVSSTLRLTDGGKPRADIAGGEINWQGEMNREVSVPLGETLCFTLTVVNIGPVPIRTSGPWSGQEYKFTENNNTLAVKEDEASWYQQAGVWRFGISFDTSGTDFPYRWAIGRKSDLEERIIDGQPQYYLLPGKRGQVSGCIRFDATPPVGTQFWKGGLIHEQVAIANDDVDRIRVIVGGP